MMEITIEYWNQLSNQIILISSLLSGFSIAFIASLLSNKEESKVIFNLLRAATVTASCFLIAVFAMTKIQMMTTPGYPMKLQPGELDMPSMVGFIAFHLGIISLCVVIALSGWTKSKRLGRFTTVVGVLTLFFTLAMLITVG